MMKQMTSLITALAIVTALIIIGAATAGCSATAHAGLRPITVNCTGTIAREERMLARVNEIRISGAFYVEIRQGDKSSLLIEADEALLPYIRSNVSGGRLELGYTSPLRLVNNDQLIRVELTTSGLDTIQFSGAGKVYSERLDADRVSIDLSGAGQIVIDDLRAERLKVKLSGAGDVRVAGEVQQQSVQISGIGNYSAGALASQDADVRISGVGQATIWVEDTLTANGTPPVSRIQVYGHPRLLSGSAQVVLLEQE